MSEGSFGSPIRAGSTVTWRGSPNGWAASARSFRARRCASTRLASEARPSRTRMPGPAIERLERGRVDDPGPARDRLEPPGPLAVEAGCGHPHPEPRIGSRLEALDLSDVTQQPEPGARGACRRGRRPGSARPGPSRSSGKRARRGRRIVQGRPDRRVAWRGRRRAARPAPASEQAGPIAPAGRPPPVPTAIVSRRSGARPSSSRGRRRSIRDARRRRRRASRNGPRRPWSSGATGA